MLPTDSDRRNKKCIEMRNKSPHENDEPWTKNWFQINDKDSIGDQTYKKLQSKYKSNRMTPNRVAY